MVFAEGANPRILQAVKVLREEKNIEPILLGNKEIILRKMTELGLESLSDLEIITPHKDKNFKDFYLDYSKEQRRNGISVYHSEDFMAQENYFGAMMIKKGLANTLISGPTLSYKDCLLPIINVVETQDNSKAAGIYILVFKNRVLFFADCTAQIDPSAENLSEIAINTANLYRLLLKREPRVAFLSYSSFGSNRHPSATKVKKAVNITKEKRPKMIIDGEMQADVAVNKGILDQLFNFNELDKAADILIFPELNSANISYKLLTQLADTSAIGPILVPMKSTVNIMQRTASVSEIVNMCTVTALLSEEEDRDES